jgi:hypothetical protein
MGCNIPLLSLTYRRNNMASETTITPEELAEEFPILKKLVDNPGLLVRNFLRKKHPRPLEEKGTPWHLGKALANEVREYVRSYLRDRGY